MNQTQIQSTEQWESGFSLSDTDLEQIYNHFLETEKPQTAAELAGLVIRSRVREQASELRRLMADSTIYQPQRSYTVGEEVIFPALKLAKGKPEHGTITLIASHQGGSIVIEVRDDGKGLNRAKLRQVRRREGHYLLRSNLERESPAKLWEFYIQLTEVEQAFKELKSDLAVRPIWHQKDKRIEAHIFVAFLAYCLQVSMKARLKALAPGLTPRTVLEKLAGLQMVDVYLPTTDGRQLLLRRYTEPDADQRLLLAQLKLQLPKQPPPQIAVSLPAKHLSPTTV